MQSNMLVEKDTEIRNLRLQLGYNIEENEQLHNENESLRN